MLVARVRRRPARERPAGHDHPVADDERGVGLGAQGWPPVKGSLRGVEEGAAVDASPRSLTRPRPRARSAASSPAATATAIAAGSLLVVTPGRPMGVRIRSTAVGVVPVGRSCDRNRAHLADEPISPIGAEVVEPEGGVAQGDVLGVVVGHHQHVGARRQLGRAPARAAPARGARARPRRASASAASARRQAARRGSRPGAGRGRGGPGCGPARGRRGRPRRSRPPARTGSGSSSTVTSPPQHWRRARCGALSVSVRRRTSPGVGAAASSSSRARRTAVASRLPPPTLPHVCVGADHHLGAGLAGRVAAHLGDGDQHAGAPLGAQRSTAPASPSQAPAPRRPARRHRRRPPGMTPSTRVPAGRAARPPSRPPRAWPARRGRR